MVPSSRAPLGALLLALLLRALPAPACSRLPPGHRHLFADAPGGGPRIEIGACAGGAPSMRPPEDGVPARLSALKARPGWDAAPPSWHGYGPSLRDLGYREDAAGDRLLGPDGAPVAGPRAEWLLANADAGSARIPALSWMSLQTNGYRLDETDCSFRHPRFPPLSNLALDWLQLQVDRSTQRIGLEALKAGLRGLPPGAPVPPELIARLRQMETAQVQLPEELRRRLFAEKPPLVSEVSSSVDAAYAAVNAYFDGQRTLEDFVTAARPPGTPGSQPARDPSAMRPEERRLGELLSRELQAAFESTEPGRELLAQFRRPDGSVRLPPVLVLKLTQRPDDPNAPGAIYNHESREVVMNHWEVLGAVLSELPEAERAARGRELADAAALGRYLEAHPDVRRRVVERLDFAVLHEFVHYRQGDVSRVMDEQRRLNVPDTNPQSLEHEAHRQECRYFLSRVARDPSLLARGYGGNRLQYCPGVLQDPARLEAYVTDLYSRTFAGSQTLPQVRDMQAARRDDAMATMLSASATWEQRARAALKLIGFEHGDAALEHEQARIAAERAAYDRAILPLREQSAGVPAALMRLGKPYTALLFLSQAGWEGREEQARATLRDAQVVLGSRDRRSTLEERLAAFPLVVNLGARLGSSDWSPSFRDGLAADMREYAARLRSQAAAQPGDAAARLRREAADWEAAAQSWSPRAPAAEPRPRQRVPRREERR